MTAPETIVLDAACSATRSLAASHPDIRRGRALVLHAGTVHLPPGACIGLVGINGSGKSTLLLALAGLLRGTTVRWSLTPDCLTPNRLTPDRLTPPTVGYVPQHPTFPDDVPIDRLLAVHGLDRSDIAGVDATCLPGDRSRRARDLTTLSGGQRQRLAVAISLARRDPLVLMDEPFANVDIPSRRTLAAAIRERRRVQPDVTILLSSHAAADLHALCDALIVLRDGRTVFAGAVDGLNGRDGASGSIDEFERAVAAMMGG